MVKNVNAICHTLRRFTPNPGTPLKNGTPPMPKSVHLALRSVLAAGQRWQPASRRNISGLADRMVGVECGATSKTDIQKNSLVLYYRVVRGITFVHARKWSTPTHKRAVFFYGPLCLSTRTQTSKRLVPVHVCSPKLCKEQLPTSGDSL